MKKPNSMRHLDDAIRRLSGNTPQGFMQARTVMANAIVASMLPDGVVKGGTRSRCVSAMLRRGLLPISIPPRL